MKPGVTVNYEFIFWELHGTFPMLVVAGLSLPNGKSHGFELS
jgi:hypothetical protein